MRLPVEPKQAVVADTMPTQVSADITFDENFSPEGFLAQDIRANSVQDKQKFYDRYTSLYGPDSAPVETFTNVYDQAARVKTPREQSALLRYQRIQALSRLHASHPQTLDQFPSLVKALAARPDISQKDVTNMISLSLMESAFQRIISTDDPTGIAQANIFLTMNPVQQAAFGDFYETRFSQLIKDTAADPNSPMNGVGWLWNHSLGPVFDKLWAVNRLAYRGVTGIAWDATHMGEYENTDATGWDKAAPGSYDPDQINQLKDKYGAYKVDILLDFSKEIELGDGEDGSTPYMRWIQKHLDDPDALAIIRKVTNSRIADPELMEITRGIEMASTSNIGQVLLSNIFPGARTSEAMLQAAGLLNFTTTIAVDPTGKIAAIFKSARMLRYGLQKIDPSAGAVNDLKSAAKIVRTGQFGNVMKLLISDFAKVREVKAAEAAGKAKPGSAAATRAAVSRNFGKHFDEDLLVEMETWNGHGIRNMDDAAVWMYENSAAPRIIQGRAAAKYSTVAEAREDPLVNFVDDLGMPKNSWMEQGKNPLFERLRLSESNMQTRTPLLPTISRGIMTYPVALARNRFRMAMATRNPIDNAGRKTIAKVFPNTSSSAVAGEISKNPKGIANIEGIERRAPEDLLNVLSLSGNGTGAFRYSQKGVAAAADRVLRLGARKPNGDIIYVNSARDTRHVYELARAFFTKYTAQTIAQAFREGTVAERRLIVNGLVKSIHEARGINSERLARFAENDIDKAKLAQSVGITGSQIGERYAPTIRRIEGVADPATTANNPLLLSQKTWETNPSKWVSDNGTSREHALHVWQTSDYIRLPDYASFDKVSQKAGVWWTLFGWTNRPISQTLTDYWSFGTLVGPRFVIRNAIEDYTMWYITQGRWSDVVIGRRGSTLVRAARGSQYKQGGWTGKEGWQSRLGVVNRQLPASKKSKAEMAADNAAGEKFGNSSLFRYVREYMTDAEWEAYKSAVRGERTEEIQTILGTAWARGQAGKFMNGALKGPTGMNERQAAAAAWLTQHGRVMDDMSEASMMLNSAMPTSLADRLAEQAVQGTYVNGQIKYPVRGWEDAAGAEAPLHFYLQWHRDITGIVKTDGAIGEIAILNLGRISKDPSTRDDVVRRIVDAIVDDTKIGYKERFSAIYEQDATIEDFANRYLASVQNTFSKADGSLNTDLWNKLVRHQSGKPVDIDLTKLTFDDLRSYSQQMRPAYVNARAYSEVPVFTELTRIDRMWEMMGNSYSRFSKEPIFMANVFREAKDLEPYYNWLKGVVGEKAANTRVNQLAVDRAYGLTMSYVDNPANRTLFAWNMRNVSRYYRATEDFVRRMVRVTSNYPEGLWKTALTYQALDETGFVYTDQYGDKYFMYPVTGFLGEVIQKAFGLANGTLPLHPLSLGGKIKMLTPSTDPNQLIPGLSGPVLAFPMAALLGMFPQVDAFQSVATGEYSVGQSAWAQLMPAGVNRIWNLLAPDDQDNIVANATMGAAAIAIAAGYGPTKNSTNVHQIEDFKKAIGDIALQVVVLKTILGYIVPASPQIYMNDVTDLARKAGITGMRPLFLNILESQGDSPTAFTDALTEWVKIYGTEALPYTESKSKPVADLGANLYTATTSAVSEVTMKFIRDNAEVVEKFPVAATYLFPRGKDFSLTTWSWYIGKGYKENHTETTFIQALLSAEGRYERDRIDRQIDQEVLDLQNAGKDSEAAYRDNQFRAAMHQQLQGSYPWLTEQDVNSNNPLQYATSMNQLLNGNGDDTGDMRKMIAWYKRPDATEPVPESIKNIDYAIRVYDRYSKGPEDQYGPPGFRIIEGQSNAAVALRKQVREFLTAQLTELATKDPQVEVVVQKILLPLVNARSIVGGNW